MASASSMPSTDQGQDLKRLLECSICLETFDDPRTLPCLHSFCKKCLENFVDGKRDDELNCPVCRGKFTLNEEGVTGMTRNHFICNMVEVLSIQDQNKCIPCSHCEQPTVGRCVTCELFMCEKCLQSHNGYIGFRDHVVLTMEELSKPENQSKIKGKSFCKKHPRISDHKAGQRKAYDIAQALIENGSNEEIMLSHKSVQQSVEKSEKGYERKEIDDEVPQYSDGQLDRMFYDEIKASKKGKGTKGGIVNLSQMWNQSPQKVVLRSIPKQENWSLLMHIVTPQMLM